MADAPERDGLFGPDISDEPRETVIIDLGFDTDRESWQLVNRWVLLEHQRASALREFRVLLAEATRLATAERDKLLKRYLDNHCANSDAEGMSTPCECKVCSDTRAGIYTNLNENSDGEQSPPTT